MLKRVTLLSLPLLFVSAHAAGQSGPAAIEGYTHVKALGGIDEYRLDTNGLEVLIKPDHSAPVVTFQVTYRVGSRNEVTGTTGATHLLEHLMFKGTDAFNREKGNAVDQYLEKVGGRYNATTWMDRTNYFGTLGRDSLEHYIAIEADRMRNLRLRESDRQAEMTVVRNEFERGENSPERALIKEVYATAFQAQPYHHSTIGWKSDIERVPIEKLRQFYDTFYWPDNATVTIVGDVEAAHALAIVKRYFGTIPRAPQPIPVMYTEEPPQTGPRRVTFKRAGELGRLMVAYKVPSSVDKDMPALMLLSSILGTGENSRLSRALVNTSLATAAKGEIFPARDPGLFMISAALAPGATHEQVEKILVSEIEKVKESGVTDEELVRAASQYRAQQAFERDGTAAIASALNEWIASGDWTHFVSEADAVSKVTPADIQRVARAYLNEDQSTTGWFVPKVSK